MWHVPAVLVLVLSAGCGHADKPEKVVATNDKGMALAATIRSQLIGHTVTGKMTSGSQYGEYYAPDGTIRAADYSGAWHLSGDTLCLDYGSSNAPPDCYGVKIAGQDVQWYLDGTLRGQGTAVPGNPNHF